MPDAPPDYQYGNNAGFDLSFRSLMGRLEHDAIRAVANSFLENVNRATVIWALPVEAAHWGSVIGQLHNLAFGKLTDLPERTPVQEVINIDLLIDADRKRLNRITDDLFSQWFALSRNSDIPKQDRLNTAWKMGVYLLSLISNLKPEISSGLEATLASSVMGAWTAFEVLASDLWVAAINHGPAKWSKKIFKAQTAGGGLKPDEDSKSKYQERSIFLTKVHEYGYNLRGKIGDLLKSEKKVDFQSLENTRRAYAAVFGKPVDDIFDHEGHREIEFLEAARNLIAHRGGIADRKFIGQSKRFPKFATLTEGERLNINGPMTTSLLNCTTRLGSSLLLFVDGQFAAFEPFCPVI